MAYGFIRFAVAVPELLVADCSFNADRIIEMIIRAADDGVDAVCFPELCVTGYTCADLFFQQRLLDDALAALDRIAAQTSDTTGIVIVGLPLRVGYQLFNVAVVLQGGKILGCVPKINLPNNAEFYEKRWFASGKTLNIKETVIRERTVPIGNDLLFANSQYTFGIELCEDLWMPIPPSSRQALNGADVIFNLSASNELIGKHSYRRQLVAQQSARCNAGYVYVSAGSGESTTDIVFTGNAIIAENGKFVAEAERFSIEPQLLVAEIDIERLHADRVRNTNFANDRSSSPPRVLPIGEIAEYPQPRMLRRKIEKHPFVPAETERGESFNEILSIQVGGLGKRWRHTQAKCVVMGVSGGLDSTLALLVCAKTCDKFGFDRKQVVGISMPGFGTTERTQNNATELMTALGVTSLNIPITDAVLQHFRDIGHDVNIHDITYENSQARERTQILMDVANQRGGFVVGTGDMSELALGWATYNGDHISMYGVNNGVPKTLVRYLVDWAAKSFDDDVRKILSDILTTPISPELLPPDSKGNIAQKTEDIIGPYELHDFFLYYIVRFGFSPEKVVFLATNAFADCYSEDEIRRWLKVFLKRFFAQQFKRSCMPDGPKVGTINLSPRGDWRMPSDAVGW